MKIFATCIVPPDYALTGRIKEFQKLQNHKCFYKYENAV